MFASASIAQTLRGTKCGIGDCMQSSKKCLDASKIKTCQLKEDPSISPEGLTIEELDDSRLQVAAKVLCSNSCDTAKLA
jgi:hypothetical protein